MAVPRRQDVGLAVKWLLWRHHSTADKQLATRMLDRGLLERVAGPGRAGRGGAGPGSTG